MAAYVTTEVAQTKRWCHMAAYGNVICHTRVHVHACVSACVCVWACVCMNNEIAPFSRILLSHYVHIPYICVDSSDFLSCGTIFLFL